LTHKRRDDIMAWWLAYEELYGNMDEEYPIMKKREDEHEVTTLGGDDTITFSGDGIYAADSVPIDQSFWNDDGFSLTGNPYYRRDSKPPVTFGGGTDTLDLGPTRLPGGMGEDHISFNISTAGTAWNDNKYYAEGVDPYPTAGSVDSLEFNTKPKPDLKGSSSQKYQEDKGIKDLKDYVASTYQGHYTNDNSDVQTLDLIHSVGDAESFCRSNAIKYLSRYDKKGQAKRDILKAMHYCLLLYYFSGNTNDEITTRGYETF